MSSEQQTSGESQSQTTEKKASEKTINKRLQRTQAQVNEVVDIMRVNIEKVLERDKNLSQLDDRADALQAGASQFEASAGKLKRKFWWRNCKLVMVLCGLLAIIAIVVIVALTSGKREGNHANTSSLVDGNMSSSLSSELPQFEGGQFPGSEEGEFSYTVPQEQPQQQSLRREEELAEKQDQVTPQSSKPVHSSSRSNGIIPRGIEAVPPWSEAKLTPLLSSSSEQEEGTLANSGV